MVDIQPAAVEKLPLPDLALRLLRTLSGDQINFNNVIRGMQQSGRMPGWNSAEYTDLHLARIADAWAWLESHALLAPSQINPATGNWQRVSELGQAVAQDPHAITKVWADERLAGDLDPALASARSNFALGDYETAAFAAMKAVEVAVREAAGLPSDLLGVGLMRKAFSPKDGALRDTGAEGGEQQATADLFAGAIGAYKNPASHRSVQFEDPIEASEVIQLADLLLRIVRRAVARTGS